MAAFTDAWQLLKSRTERGYPPMLQQGRAGTQTQHNPMNMESRIKNPPGRMRMQGKEAAMAQILEGMKPQDNEMMESEDDMPMPNEEEMAMHRTQPTNKRTLAEDMAMAAMMNR
jgi:hypothetical protein